MENITELKGVARTLLAALKVKKKMSITENYQVIILKKD